MGEPLARLVLGFGARIQRWQRHASFGRQAFDRLGKRQALGLLEKGDQVAMLARGEIVEEAFVVIDEERRRALLGERRQADVFPALAAQLDGLADDVGQPEPSLDLIQETFVVAHGGDDCASPGASRKRSMERRRIADAP